MFTLNPILHHCISITQMKKKFTLLAFVALCATSQGALISHYSFDASNGNDSAGTNNLTSTGTVTYTATGVPPGLGLAAAVGNNPNDNSNSPSYLSITAGISAGGYSFTNFSVSIWFSETVSMTNRFNDILAISGAGGALTNLEYMTRSAAGSGVSMVNNEAFDSTSGVPWTTGTWHNAVFVGGATSISYYLDGTFVGIDNVAPTGTLAELYLFRGGANNSGIVRGWNGQIGDVQLYNQNLTTQNVAFLFANPGSAVPEPSIALLGTIGMFGFLRRRRG